MTSKKIKKYRINIMLFERLIEVSKFQRLLRLNELLQSEAD
jgi:hypothetical protein